MIRLVETVLVNDKQRKQYLAFPAEPSWRRRAVCDLTFDESDRRRRSVILCEFILRRLARANRSCGMVIVAAMNIRITVAIPPRG